MAVKTSAPLPHITQLTCCRERRLSQASASGRTSIPPFFKGFRNPSQGQLICSAKPLAAFTTRAPPLPVQGNLAKVEASVMAPNSAAEAAACAEEYVELAHKLADKAGDVILKYFRTSFDVEDKLDASPVTIADREAEAAMRSIIAESQPSHGIFGEEWGFKAGDGIDEYTWVLDPIDGTKSFITGKPLFGTLIALVHRGVPILGIIDQPVLKERWVGVAGRPSTLNGAPIATRPCDDIAKAYLYATTPHMFAGASEEAFARVRDKVRMPLYGCDCYAYGLLAAGHVDLVVEADLKPYDFLALVPVVEGAGGIMSDWRGQPLRWSPLSLSESSSAAPVEVVAAGSLAVHAAALRELAWT